jgi:uncharacterized oxidoreductase
MKLSGNTILITGGSSGIGLELAKSLIKLGNKVIITGRDAARLKQAKESFPGLECIQSDAGKLTDIEELHRRVTSDFPDANILINNAGIMKKVNLHHAADDLPGLVEEIDVNLMSQIRMAAKFIPHLKTKKSAAIVNNSSALAFIPFPIVPVYCATKAGIHAFTQCLRVQLKNTNIKVFELLPPATRTPIMDWVVRESGNGIPQMPVEDMVRETIKALKQDRLEICPGPANLLKIVSRIAPNLIFSQMVKITDRLLAEPG